MTPDIVVRTRGECASCRRGGRIVVREGGGPWLCPDCVDPPREPTPWWVLATLFAGGCALAALRLFAW